MTYLSQEDIENMHFVAFGTGIMYVVLVMWMFIVGCVAWASRYKSLEQRIAAGTFPLVNC